MATNVPYKAYLQGNEVLFGAYPNTPNGQAEGSVKSVYDALTGLAKDTNRGDVNSRTLAAQHLASVGTIGDTINDQQYQALRNAYAALYPKADFNGFDSVFKPGAINQSDYVINDQGTYTTAAAEQQTAQNEAAVAAGTMTKVQQGNGFVYYPTGSAAAAQTAGKPNPNGAPAAAPAATAAVAPAPTIPTVQLQPGNSGDAVKKLQDFLVSKGLMTQDQVNTGYGTYGPQTTAAVLALQKSLGIDYSSGPGYFGPKTIAALQSAGATPQIGVGSGAGTGAGGSGGAGTGGSGTGGASTPATNPTQDVIDTYTQVYKSLGLTDVKASYEKVLKDQADLTNTMNDEIANVNENPWLSQGVRDSRIQQIKNRYETRLNTYTHLATLYDSMYKEGQSQAQFLVGQIQDDKAAAILAAQKKQDAIDALTKDNDIVETNGRKVLVSKVNGKVIADLGAATSAVDTNTLNAADRQALLGAGFASSEVNQIQKDVSQYGLTKVLDGVTDKAQKAALEKVYGAQQKVTRDQVSTTVTQKIAHDGLKDAYTDQELKQFADEAGASSFWTGTAGDIEKYLNSPAAKEKYIDLLYNQYKAAGMAQ